MKASEPWGRAGDKIRLPAFNLDLWKYDGEPGSLIPLLQAAQRDYSYIPEAAIHYISNIVGIPPAQIYGVITFYTQFRLKPLGKYLLRICNGTACHVNGSKLMGQVIEDELGIGVGQTTEDGLFTVQSVACLGCCSLSPVMMINDDTHGRLDPKKIRKILKSYQAAG
ncbi:MAG: NADH-quinone oxidoreductase subunit NuoE [Deltaproteobacteria bacterium]|nr:NADH-quinone oxidoreductase subunit NuoE [Deltaproteobacteria bacterium]